MIGEIILPLALSTVTVWQYEYGFPMLPVLQMGKQVQKECHCGKDARLASGRPLCPRRAGPVVSWDHPASPSCPVAPSAALSLGFAWWVGSLIKAGGKNVCFSPPHLL